MFVGASAYRAGVPNDAVVLDACVLYPLPLRDTLLRLAQRRIFAMPWTERILEEVTRNLIADHRATPEQAERMVGAIRAVFAASEIPAATVAAVEPAMTITPSDRHVLAAAVASEDAKAIVTLNIRHFPATTCDLLGIAVLHPDALLCGLYERAPEQTHLVLSEQAAALSRPPMKVNDVLERLRATVPEFVARVEGAER